MITAPILAGLPIFHISQSIEVILLVMYLVARVTGMIFISPLLSNISIPTSTRALLTFFIASILATVLYPDYFGVRARFFPSALDVGPALNLVIILMTMIKEMAIGFMMGFAFNLIFEAILIAGQVLSVMIGFSMAEILDPVSGTSQSSISQIFTLSASLIIIALDLHHSFFYITAKSFQYIPLGHYHMPQELLQEVAHGSSRMLTYAIRIPAAPYSILFLITIALGFMAKVMPEMNIFMVGFPLRILIGFYGLIFAVQHFPSIFKQGFHEFTNLAIHFIRHIGHTT